MREKEAAEQLKKAQGIVRDAKAYAKLQAAACEECKAQLSERAIAMETR
jgi:hypothetical protein